MKSINKYLVNRHVSKNDGIELTEQEVRRYIYPNCNRLCKVTIRYEQGKPIVDIDGNFVLREDVTEIPFQLGTVTGYFNCADCKKLTSLEGFPKKVGGNFHCVRCNKLTSLKGCPEEVGENFYCSGCGKKFIEDEVRQYCNVNGNVYVD